MPIVVTATKSINVGQPVEVQGDAPDGPFSAVFEDDGETGYFYFLDFGSGEQPIRDAIHVYNVSDVTDKDVPSEVKIGWSVDGSNVVLLVNGYPHVAFASASKTAHSRSCFPPPAPGSGWARAEWSEQATHLFARES